MLLSQSSILSAPFSQSCPATPFPAALTSHLQSHQNTTALSPAFAALTNQVTRNSFVCHSYKKHPGVGWAASFKPQFFDLPPQTSRLTTRISSFQFRISVRSPYRALKSFTIRTSAKYTRNPFGIRTYKTQDLKPFRMNTYKKTGGDPLSCALRPKFAVVWPQWIVAFTDSPLSAIVPLRRARTRISFWPAPPSSERP